MPVVRQPTSCRPGPLGSVPRRVPPRRLRAVRRRSSGCVEPGGSHRSRAIPSSGRSFRSVDNSRRTCTDCRLDRRRPEGEPGTDDSRGRMSSDSNSGTASFATIPGGGSRGDQRGGAADLSPLRPAFAARVRADPGRGRRHGPPPGPNVGPEHRAGAPTRGGAPAHPGHPSINCPSTRASSRRPTDRAAHRGRVRRTHGRCDRRLVSDDDGKPVSPDEVRTLVQPKPHNHHGAGRPQRPRSVRCPPSRPRHRWSRQSRAPDPTRQSGIRTGRMIARDVAPPTARPPDARVFVPVLGIDDRRPTVPRVTGAAACSNRECRADRP